jgi:hypothetical protein
VSLVRTAGPPAAAERAVDVRVAAVLTREFDPAGLTLPPEHREALGVYLADLVRPYGLAPPVGPFDGGHSYGEMGEALIRTTVGPDAPVDLLVVAYAIPDVRPGRATAAYLSYVCPGVPMSFAICDQASAAPFSGLRLIREYARTGGCRRALLLVVEQSALHHEPARPVTVPTGHTGCAIRCDVDGSTGPRLAPPRQHVGVTADRVAATLADDLAALADDRGPVTLILGGGMPAHGFDPWCARVRVAASGRPLTGVWTELAAELTDGPGPGLVVVADHAPDLGYLSVAVLDRGADGA